jgi:hypothetical protein
MSIGGIPVRKARFVITYANDVGHETFAEKDSPAHLDIDL